MQCPACHDELIAGSTRHGTVYHCQRCSGTLIHLNELREHVSPRVIDALWGCALGSPASPDRRCPGCSQRFRIYDVRYGPADAPFQLDICTRCEWFWFDATELQRIPLARAMQVRRVDWSHFVLDLLAALVEAML